MAQIIEQEPLAPHTTFHLGGPARYFVRIASIEELGEALAFAKEKDVPVFYLGGGSNLLVDDEGFDGLVIKIEIKGVEQTENGFIAGAGEEWDQLVTQCVERGLWGIENLSGIPGTLGGACVQNIGAYGAVLSDTLSFIEAFDTNTETVIKIEKQTYRSGYRDSIFKHEPERYVVLRAALELSRDPKPNISYKDLAAAFIGKAPSLAELREAVLAIRAGKFPDIHIVGTAGSFFKNPVVSAEEAKLLAEKYPGMPLFPLPESNGMKVPLGWLLDWRHGVIDMRDVRLGGARMYEKQFLVLVAERGSVSRDVIELAQIVKKKIKDACNIDIEPEVKILAR